MPDRAPLDLSCAVRSCVVTALVQQCRKRLDLTRFHLQKVRFCVSSSSKGRKPASRTNRAAVFDLCNKIRKEMTAYDNILRRFRAYL
jgi:hypothetical protein